MLSDNIEEYHISSISPLAKQDSEDSEKLTHDDFELKAYGPNEPYSIEFDFGFKSTSEFAIEYDADPPFNGYDGESITLNVINEHKFKSLDGQAPVIPYVEEQVEVVVPEDSPASFLTNFLQALY